MEKLAIIRNVAYGMRDYHVPVLFFETEELDGCSLQLFSQPRADELIRQANVYDVKNLEGRACVIEETNGIVKVLRILSK